MAGVGHVASAEGFFLGCDFQGKLKKKKDRRILQAREATDTRIINCRVFRMAGV